MTDGQLLGLLLIIAMAAVLVWDSWSTAPLDDPRDLPLLDRIARDQAAVLHAEVEAVLKAAAGS